MIELIKTISAHLLHFSLILAHLWAKKVRRMSVAGALRPHINVIRVIMCISLDFQQVTATV